MAELLFWRIRTPEIVFEHYPEGHRQETVSRSNRPSWINDQFDGYGDKYSGRQNGEKGPANQIGQRTIYSELAISSHSSGVELIEDDLLQLFPTKYIFVAFVRFANIATNRFWDFAFRVNSEKNFVAGGARHSDFANEYSLVNCQFAKTSCHTKRQTEKCPDIFNVDPIRICL